MTHGQGDFKFLVSAGCAETSARTGIFHTPHGQVFTPGFIAVGTQGTVKSLTPRDLEELGAQIILANTYHLYLRPGVETVARLGGLHRFMAWPHPLMTDSGGFQVFSLRHLSRLDDAGATFRSHLDGSEHHLSPERATEIQEALGADIIMALDECTPFPSDHAYNVQALRRTHLWAERCLEAHSRLDQALFGIVQGGVFPDLRRESARVLTSLDFPGYAIGGLSVGEPKDTMHKMLELSVPLLPEDKPRHLLGVGSPEDLFECVARGIDLFDCVLPTRLARNGALFTRQGRINIRNARYAEDPEPIEAGCQCYTCQHFSRGYLRHLHRSQELLAHRLATIHNLHFILRLMHQIRTAIGEGTFAGLKEQFLASYRPIPYEARRKGWQARLRRLGREARS